MVRPVLKDRVDKWRDGGSLAEDDQAAEENHHKKYRH